MKNFAHINATTIDEAAAMLRRYGKGAAVIAGGTDLLGKMKDEILPAYPEALVNIKTIPGLDVIASRAGGGEGWARRRDDGAGADADRGGGGHVQDSAEL